MEVTRSGPPGGILHVANHAAEEFGSVLASAITHLRQTVEETAAGWDQLKKLGGATNIDVQVKKFI